MTQPQLPPMAWLNLDTTTRIKIAEAFGIRQTRPVHVAGGRVVDSGHDWEEVAKITVESMQQVLGSKEEDFFKLWDMVIERTKAPHPMGSTTAGSPPSGTAGGYVCGVCTDHFKTKGALTNHKKTHGTHKAK